MADAEDLIRAEGEIASSGGGDGRPVDRSARFRAACDASVHQAPDSQRGVGTSRKGARQRAWAGLTGQVRKRPRVRSMIDVARFVYGSLAGDRHECTLCGRSGKFLPFGFPPRVNAACPGCGSLERHRLLALYLRHHPQTIAGKLVLHFAPEETVSKILRAAGPELYRTADIEVGRAELQLSLEKIDLPDECVDVVVASHILEHVDDQQALSEIHRILMPGGKACIMVPIVEGWDATYENASVNTNAERVRHFGQADHIRYYGRDLRDRIRAAGFSLEEYTAEAKDCVAYGLQRGEKIFIAVK